MNGNGTRTTALFLLLLLGLFGEGTRAFADKKLPPKGIPVDAELSRGKWYKLITEKISWHQARDRCARMGGQLAVVPDAETWHFLLQRTQNALVWLGATDEAVPGIWKWIDGTPFTFTAWLQGEPNNSGGNEHYLSTLKGGWNDVPATGIYPKREKERVIGYWCEWKDR